MPLNQASVGAVSREDAADASGLYNMARNLGGSLGLALIGVFIDRQSDAHVQSIGQSITANSPLAQAQMASQTAAMGAQNGGDMALGHLQAMAQLSQTAQIQGLIISYTDCFYVLGAAMLAMIPLVFLLRPPRDPAQAVEAH
jgi:DHA2 family multidrug resistance protein